MFRTRFVRVVAASAFVTLTAAAHAGPIAPQGVYFHDYSGPFSAVEWIHIRQDPGQDRYTFSDIRGLAPYSGTITNTGAITWDSVGNQSGTGQFADNNNAQQTLIYQGQTYQSDLRRAPGTDEQFITQIESRVNGNSSIASEWNIVINELDARTGAVLETINRSATTTVIDDLLRITYDDGTYFQGVFETETTAGFRVVVPQGLGAEYHSFQGSELSLNQNLLGDFRMTGSDSFQAVMLLQTRRAPGAQVQTVFQIQGTKVPAPGSVAAIIIGASFASRRRR